MFSLRLLPLLLLLFLHTSAWAQVQVSLSRPSGALNQTFKLVVESTQRQSIDNPDLSVLEDDFEILSNNRNSLSKFSNGRTLHNTRWTLLLKPKTLGTLTIPGIRVGSERSRPMSYEVTETQAESSQGGVFIEHALEPRLNYVRSGYTLSIKLYYSTSLASAELTEPDPEDIDVIRLGDQQSYAELYNGTSYQVIEQKYLLFPLQPGQFVLDPVTFEGQDAQGNSVTASSDRIRLEALSPPQDGTEPWIAATELRIDERWERQPEALVQGDQLIRTLIIEVYNLPAKHFPRVQLQTPAGVSMRILPATRSQSDDTGVLVSRIEIPIEMSFIRAGTRTIPAVELAWWDTVRDEPEVSRLEGYSLEVAPLLSSPVSASSAEAETSQGGGDDANVAPVEQAAEASKPASAGHFPWQAWVWAFIAIVCAVGWSLSYTRYRNLAAEKRQLQQQLQTPQSQVDQQALAETSAFNRFARACHHNDSQQAAMHLIEWACLNWRGADIETLMDVDAYAEDPTLTYLLRDLEHSLFEPDDEDPWQGDLLFRHINRIRKASSR